MLVRGVRHAELECLTGGFRDGPDPLRDIWTVVYVLLYTSKFVRNQHKMNTAHLESLVEMFTSWVFFAIVLDQMRSRICETMETWSTTLLSERWHHMLSVGRLLPKAQCFNSGTCSPNTVASDAQPIDFGSCPSYCY